MGSTLPILDISRCLLDANADDYVAVAGSLLHRLLPSDDACWLQSDWGTETFVVWRAATGTRDAAAETVLPLMFEHPAIQSYVRRPTDLAPRRLSDVCQPADDGQASALYASQEYLGRHQLSMVLDVNGISGRGWIITRDGADFDDTHLGDARVLLSLLLVFDRMHKPDLAVPVPGLGDLTARERQVIDLLVTGLPATAIGHLLGVSPRTVEKHLENAYRKLDVHDRLQVARIVDRPATGHRHANAMPRTEP